MALLCASVARAEEEEHADVFVGRPAASGTQTLVGGATVPSDLNLTDRVFEGDAGIAGDTYFATEPGFFNAGTNNLENAVNPVGSLPLNSGESITVNTVGSLEYWDGTGPVSFGSTPASLTITPIPGGANPDGSIDDHPIFTIDDLLSASLPAGGIYLGTFTAELSGLSASDEFQILFVTGPEFEEAVESAEDFLNGVPEPMAATVLLIGAVAGGTLRRRIA